MWSITSHIRLERKHTCPVIGIPNQKVCPFGKVLCVDLICRDNYDLYEIFEQCEDLKKRCPDQSCHFNINHCPKTINCANYSKYVSNDNRCVDSELECKESVIWRFRRKNISLRW